ncbi:MAG: SDR family oxidoreductase [candidate division Zixibacteria bacterium]|nr:SDR family oxidoreductase [candidate division Zixibacteria bacterium]
MISLAGKSALITGGSRGIGKAIVLMFAKAGCDVVINFRSDSDSAEAVRKQAESLGVKAMIAKADISDKKQVDDMIFDAVNEMGKIDILVNNAGIWEHNPIDAMTEDNLRRTIDTNLLGVFFPIMAVVNYMKEHKWGSIINISSTAGQRGEAEYSPYSATKSAVIGITKSLAPELIRYNIRVNCVAPGWVDTDMTKPTMSSGEAAQVLTSIPMGRVGKPEELAGPVLFLASELSSFITGEVLNVNGGAVLCG